MANNEITLRIGADPTKLQSGLNRSSAAVKSFAGKARASFSAVTKSIGNINLGSVMGPLLIGGGLSYTVKEVGDFSRELMYYSMAAKKSDADTRVFRESLHDLAIQTGVDSKAILGGVAKIGEITGDFKFAEGMDKVLAKTSLAANTSMEELALLSSAINANVGWGAEKISKYFNSLIIQGDQGSFTLQKFAQEGKALFSSAAAFGLKSEEQFAYFGAMLQTIAPSIKSEAEITTSVGALFRDLKDKQKELGKKGIKIFDKVDGKNQVRDFKSIIDDIMKYVDGDAKKLAQIGLKSESMKVLNPMMADYQNKWEKMNAITSSGLEGMGNTNVLDERAERASRNFDRTMEKMKASAVKFADINLAGPVETLSNALQTLSEHQGIVTAGFVAMTAAALGIGAVKIGQLGMKGYDLYRRFFPNNKTSEARPSNEIPFSPNDVQKVFVTNMGGGFGGSNYYMDDDDVPVKKSAENVAKSVTSATKEMGRFGSAVSKARSGINKFGNNIFGGSLLTVATSWAIGEIKQFGGAFLEWRKVVNETTENSKRILDENQKNFTEKYGKETGHWGQKYDDTLLAIQKEENSFLPSEKRLDELFADLNRYRQLMQNAISNKGNGVSAEEYMRQFQPQPQNIFINVAQNGKTIVETDKGKPPKVKSKTVPFSR